MRTETRVIEKKEFLKVVVLNESEENNLLNLYNAKIIGWKLSTLFGKHITLTINNECIIDGVIDIEH